MHLMRAMAVGPRRELHCLRGTREISTFIPAGVEGLAFVPAHGHRAYIGCDGALLERAHRHDQDP